MSTQLPKYPLEQVLAVKKDRVEKAEKVVAEKRNALEIEQEKLKKVEEERDKVLKHHGDKLAQLRKVLDEGTTSEEVLQMKAYLKVVKEKVKKAEEKVKEQQEQVKIAQQGLEAALKDLHRKRIEEEKINMHKEEWEKEARKEMALYEAREQDEIGAAGYEIKRKKRKKR